MLNRFIVILATCTMLAACAPPRVVVQNPTPAPGSGRYEEPGGGPPPWAPAHGYRAKQHMYRYYPSSEVYFDTTRNVYFYPQNGAWQVSTTLPGSINLGAGSYVDLEMATDKPYTYHNDVRSHYPPGQTRGNGHGKGRGKGHGRGKGW